MTIKKVQMIENAGKAVKKISKLPKTDEQIAEKNILEKTPYVDIVDFMVDTFKVEKEYQKKLDLEKLMKSFL